MSWTDERIEALRKHWDEGLSASQIAEKLGEGVTRNAVIGKAHRLGLKSRPSPVKSEPAQAKAKPKATPKASSKVSLLDLTERICKWPIGHPTDADFHFCGKPAKPGFPYCDEHCEIAYQAQAPRRERPRPPMFGR
ncbi:MAG: GcrA family cell cycle regulator [Pseudomonadota bacterium]